MISEDIKLGVIYGRNGCDVLHQVFGLTDEVVSYIITDKYGRKPIRAHLLREIFVRWADFVVDKYEVKL